MRTKQYLFHVLGITSKSRENVCVSGGSLNSRQHAISHSKMVVLV